MNTTIADLCQALPTASFQPGEIVLPEGAKTGRIYVLLEGTVDVLKGDFPINVVSERGAIFGDMAALLDIPHMATVKARTACTFHVSHAGADFLKSDTEITYLLAQLIAQRLHGVTSYLVDIKRQFEDHESHLGMVDEILESLLHQQRRPFTPGSDRDPE